MANGIHNCQHKSLTYASSTYSSKAGFVRPSATQRAAAAFPSGRLPRDRASVPEEDCTVFPAPLVLPGDAHDQDPKAPSQSLLSWIREKDRNEVTDVRCTVYVAEAPRIDDSIKILRRWYRPRSNCTQSLVETPVPKADQVVKYLQAFYWPLPVKVLTGLQFSEWEEADAGPAMAATSPPLALLDPSTGEATRISTRPSSTGPFSHQLSCNNLIDGMIASLPEDAYAMVLVVHHDIWEDDEDDFTIGRAYGADRIAVVSTARYHPSLDEYHKVDVQHTWPASHCLAFVENRNGARTDPRAIGEQQPAVQAVQAALHHHIRELARSDPQKTWLNRVCRTASHELGHCFGLDHCTYFACIMQSSSSVAEDVRQPGYLCPVDLAKVLRATGATEVEHCEVMAEACKACGPGGGFEAMAAWYEARREGLAAAARSGMGQACFLPQQGEERLPQQPKSAKRRRYAG